MLLPSMTRSFISFPLKNWYILILSLLPDIVKEYFTNKRIYCFFSPSAFLRGIFPWTFRSLPPRRHSFSFCDARGLSFRSCSTDTLVYRSFFSRTHAYARLFLSENSVCLAFLRKLIFFPARFLSFRGEWGRILSENGGHSHDVLLNINNITE